MARLEIDVAFLDEARYVAGFTEQLSATDCFVATHRSEPVGARFEMLLHLSPPEPPTKVLAEVRWLRASAPDRNLPPGLGLAFVEPSSAAVGAIERRVARAPRARQG